MNREQLESIMRGAQWSKDRCVAFSINCARSLIAHSPDPIVATYIQQIEDYRSSDYRDKDMRKLVNAISRPVAILRKANQGRARECCHATLHASEAALAGSEVSSYGHGSRSWAAIAAADPEVANQLLESEGLTP